MATFFEKVREAVIDMLPEMEGYNSYGCDFAEDLFDDRIMDYFDFKEGEAVEFIKEHFHEAGEYLQYEDAHFGKILTNPFLNPVYAANSMVLRATRNILAGSGPVEKYWDDRHEFTDEDIKEILAHVETFEWDGF